MAERKPPPKVGETIIATRNHTRKFLLVKDQVLKAGTSVILTEIHTNCWGTWTHVTVREPKSGEFFEKVPPDVFRRR